jgi:hypothetical protein
MSKSRYFPTPLLDGNHYETFDYPRAFHGIAPIDFLVGLNSVQHVFGIGDRLDKLAFKYFQDERYWWVISLVNAITYPLGISPGTVLQIPTDLSSVLKKLDMV